ncbi:MAG: hypothetical protein V1663_01420 [archaeon]
MYSLNKIRNTLIFISCFTFSLAMSSYQSIYENMKKHPEVIEYYRRNLEDDIIGNYVIENENIRKIVDENKSCATKGFVSLFVTSVSLVGLILAMEKKSS